MSALLKLAAGVIVALIVYASYERWQNQQLRVEVSNAAVAPAQVVSDLAAAQVETVTKVLAAKRDTVLRVLHDTVEVPANLLHPVTSGDTASAVAALPKVKAERDSIAKSCRAFVVTCDEFRVKALAKFHADSDLVHSLSARKPQERRFSLGLTVGYGATAFRDSTNTWRAVSGPSVTLGAQWRLY